MRFNPTERLREHRDNYNKTGERINMAGADLSYHLFQSGDLLIEGVDMAGADLSRSTFRYAYIDGKLNDVQFLTQNNSNRTTEIEKDIIRLMAILPNRAEVPKLKEHEDN